MDGLNLTWILKLVGINTVDTDGDGVPDIYNSTEFYFASRGEKLNLDLTTIPEGGSVQIVLPLAMPGDQI